MAKERRRTASKVLQYLALMLLVMQVCLCLFGFFFLSCCHTHVNKNHNTAGMVRFRQLGWSLTSGKTCNCLYAGETFVQWDHGMHPWALGVLIVENGYHRGDIGQAH